jgi:adenine-specific DNA-methyltransferase
MQKTLSEYTNEELIELVQSLKRTKKFGLVWEDKPEQVAIDCEEKLPVVEEVVERAITKSDNVPTNLIIEGDNYHSLSVLNYTHAGKVDVIYIDPPYNTGNEDFIYNDRFIDREDGFRHSKWLSFMEKRLKLAKHLLSEAGVIFISIDDNEQAHLKLLCDEIFGENNFVNMISVKTKQGAGASGGGEDKKLKKNIEYLLVYTRSVDFAPIFNTVYKKTEISELLGQYKENGVSWKYTSVITKRGDKEYIGSTVDGDGNSIDIYKRENTEFKSVQRIAKDENITEQDVYAKYFDDIFVTAMPQSSIRPRVLEYIGHSNLDKNSVYSIEYVPKTGRNKGKRYEQFYKGEKLRLFAWFSDVAEKEDGIVYKKDIEGTLWDGINLNNLSKEGDVVFDNGKKPVALLARIVRMYPYNSATVLDFFAGSGTTGHAVLELNKEDGGNRDFILCTNNENGIAENKTYKRIGNVIGGYSNINGIPANIRYFKTDFVDKADTTDQTRVALVARATDMIKIRENTFQKVIEMDLCKIYENADTYSVIIFDPSAIETAKAEIVKLSSDKPVRIYIFSLANDSFGSDFADLTHNIQLCPIPESILEVYKRIFRKDGKND